MILILVLNRYRLLRLKNKEGGSAKKLNYWGGGSPEIKFWGRGTPEIKFSTPPEGGSCLQEDSGLQGNGLYHGEHWGWPKDPGVLARIKFCGSFFADFHPYLLNGIALNHA